jgi:hypothetical protein
MEALQKGFLPDTGAYLDQSNRFLDYMDIIGEGVREQRENEMVKQNRKLKNG